MNEYSLKARLILRQERLPLEYQLFFLPMCDPKLMLVHTKKQITIIVVANIYEKADSSLLRQPPVLLFYMKYSYTCTPSVSHTPPIYIHQAQTYIRLLSASLMSLFCS